jgi:hypothetical protein
MEVVVDGKLLLRGGYLSRGLLGFQFQRGNKVMDDVSILAVDVPRSHGIWWAMHASDAVSIRNDYPANQFPGLTVSSVSDLLNDGFELSMIRSIIDERTISLSDFHNSNELKNVIELYGSLGGRESI